MKFIELGDIHLKNKEPYLTGLKKLFNYLIEKYGDYILLQSGDFFDTSVPHYDYIYSIGADFLKSFKEVHLITGNHDVSQIRGNCLTTLSRIQNIHVYDSIEDVQIGDVRVKFIPYPFKKSIRDMLEDTSKLKDCDLSLSHTSPIGKNFGMDEYLYKFKSTLGHDFGHVHNHMNFTIEGIPHCVLGVPQTTRNLEHLFKKYIKIYDDGKVTIEQLPEFMTIEDVRYGDEPSSKDNFINVYDAPSVDSVEEKYKSYNIRREGIRLLRTELSSNTLDSKLDSILGSKKLINTFMQYAKDNSISDEVIRSVLDSLNEATTSKLVSDD